MSNKTKPATDLAAVIKSLKGYLLEKGHCFERGPRWLRQIDKCLIVSLVTRNSHHVDESLIRPVDHDGLLASAVRVDYRGDPALPAA